MTYTTIKHEGSVDVDNNLVIKSYSGRFCHTCFSLSITAAWYNSTLEDEDEGDMTYCPVCQTGHKFQFEGEE